MPNDGGPFHNSVPIKVAVSGVYAREGQVSQAPGRDLQTAGSSEEPVRRDGKQQCRWHIEVETLVAASQQLEL